jgi:hypothetical protein
MKPIYLHLHSVINPLQYNATQAIRWIDFDMGQLDDENPPVSYPCCLIGFGDATYTSVSRLLQTATVTINLRIAFRVFERTHSKAQTNYQNIGLDHLNILELVHKAVQNSTAPPAFTIVGQANFEFGPLNRIAFNNERRADLRIYNLTYTTEVWDTLANPITPIDQNPNYNPAQGPIQLNFCNPPVII